MPDIDENRSLPGLEQDMFIEDADSRFRWRDIPLEGWICLPVFWCLASVVFWQFFTRYALNNAAVWTEEIARQLLILLTFFGAAFAIRTRAHICITFFTGRLRGIPARMIGELSCLLQLAFYSYSAFLCLKIAKATQFQMLMSIDLSKSVIYTAVAIAFAGMAVRTLIDMIRILLAYRRKTEPSAPPGLPATDVNRSRG